MPAYKLSYYASRFFMQGKCGVKFNSRKIGVALNKVEEIVFFQES